MRNSQWHPGQGIVSLAKEVGLGSTAEFWKLAYPPKHLAVIDEANRIEKTYGELRADVERAAATMPNNGKKSLVVLRAQNRYQCLVTYLATLNLGHALLLVDSTLNRELFLHIVACYQPQHIFGGPTPGEIPGYRNYSDEGLLILENGSREGTGLHESLAVLLNTSGSTGSPKLVRLSKDNLQANARAIASYLHLDPEERPITSLPMAYSYGLSVINSHLLAGATLILSEHSVLRREFWDTVDRYRCTSFAGVPYTYQMLLQTGLLKRRGSSLRTLTQAGGALAPEYICQMYQLALEQGFKFFVMYGQTEATARISYVPFEALGTKVGSIGIAIPEGSLSMDASTGELIYSGPNVMLGYAECREDLGKGDELHGVLRTGDLARQDADGFFYVTGRLKRFLKLFGKRFNLDEVEQILQRRFGFPVASFGRDDLLMLAVESSNISREVVASVVRETFGLPKDAIWVETVQHLPRTARGKTDYQALTAAHSFAAAGACRIGKEEMEELAREQRS